jgi:GNAT superfamily N-acetyltransferase
MELKLNKTNKEDIKIISEIYAKEFSKAPYCENWTMKKALDKMNFYLKYYDLFSISTDKKIIGFIVINPNFMCPGEIAFGEEMAIKEDFQGKGVGTWALNQIFEMYKKRGFKKFLGIADTKSRAYNLYKRLGILPSKKDVLIEKELK